MNEDAGPGDFVEQRGQGGDAEENESECAERIGRRGLVFPWLPPGVRQATFLAEQNRGSSDRNVEQGGRPKGESHSDELDQEKSPPAPCPPWRPSVFKP